MNIMYFIQRLTDFMRLQRLTDIKDELVEVHLVARRDHGGFHNIDGEAYLAVDSNGGRENIRRYTNVGIAGKWRKAARH